MDVNNKESGAANIEDESLAAKLKKYVQNTRQVLALSNVRVADLKNSREYAGALRENFNGIRPLAAENRAILADMLDPILTSAEPLSEEQVQALTEFQNELREGYLIGILDTQITAKTVSRLYQDALAKEDTSGIVHQLDALLEAYCAFITYAASVSGERGIVPDYLKKAEDLAQRVEELMQKENFARIADEEMKEIVLTNYRYMPRIYEQMLHDQNAKKKMFAQYHNAFAVLEDPFYREEVPDFNWAFYELMLAGSVAPMSASNNKAGFDEKELAFIWECAERTYRVWSENEMFRARIPECSIRLYVLLNRYLTGRMSKADYKAELLKMYDSRNEAVFSLDGIYENVIAPIEYLSLIKGERITEKERRYVLEFYRSVVAYGHNAQNSGELMAILNNYYGFLREFVEAADELTFERMCMESFAALHPPTYIHSNMVALFSRCICSHLLDQRPELFIGVLGCRDVKEVARRRSEITERIYHGALVHDLGKLGIIETIFVYGRNITDDEYQMIRTHPEVGYALAAKGTSLYTYRDIIQGHHRTYDEKGGYPPKKDDKPIPDKILIDIVTIADCLDAATDTVGRSYTKGKTLDQFKEELKAGRGTRYSPDVADLFADPKVYADIQYLLTEGRDKIYEDTYYLLKNVQQAERE